MWRRLELPSTLRLDELHGVLQSVFGWTDSHLHRFSLGDSAWDEQAERFLCPYDVEEGEDDGAPTCDVRLDEVLTLPGDHLLYTYDYGDEWNHRSHHRPWSRRRRPARRGRRPRPGPGRRPPPAAAPRAAAAGRSPAAVPVAAPTAPAMSARQPGRTALRRRPISRCRRLRRYVWLLHRVGDGLPLTAAGWLPPAVVTEVMDALWPQDRWIGKRNREDLTEPVRRLRASAQGLGLLRVNRGRLLVTKAGAVLRDDPTRLWQHLAERLVGKPKDPFTRTMTALLLLAAAGSIDDGQLAAVLTAAGWSGRAGTGVHRYAVRPAAGHVDEMLDLASAYEARGSVTAAGRMLARAALRFR